MALTTTIIETEPLRPCGVAAHRRGVLCTPGRQAELRPFGGPQSDAGHNRLGNLPHGVAYSGGGRTDP